MLKLYMAKPPRPPRPIERTSSTKDGVVRGRALKPARGSGMQPELFDGPLPTFVEPCLATLRANVPAGDRWVHEIKWDGYRLNPHRERQGHDPDPPWVMTGPTASRRSATPPRRCR